jgi:hypothetical protein
MVQGDTPESDSLTLSSPQSALGRDKKAEKSRKFLAKTGGKSQEKKSSPKLPAGLPSAPLSYLSERPIKE